MKPSNSKIPTLQLNAAAEKASPLPKAKSEIFQLKRQLQGIRIPDGGLETLPAGVDAYLTQALGSTFTIAVNGQLYRIDGEEGDALHQAKRPALDPKLLTQPVNPETVKTLLKTCFDPEIPVNLWDLGLIYSIKIPSADTIEIDMTLTAPGCGMGDVLVQDIRQKLLKLPSIQHVDVQLIFDPPWSRDKISTTGKLALGLL